DIVSAAEPSSTSISAKNVICNAPATAPDFEPRPRFPLPSGALADAGAHGGSRAWGAVTEKAFASTPASRCEMVSSDAAPGRSPCLSGGRCSGQTQPPLVY